MCVQANVDSVWCDTVGKLKAALGISHHIKEDCYDSDPPDDDCCLCGVNVEAMAEAAGYEDVTQDDWGDWHCYKRKATK